MDNDNVLKAVIFDHSTILLDERKTELLNEVREMLLCLRALGLKIVVFSTWPKHIKEQLDRRGLPSVDLYLNSEDVGARKGSLRWISEAAEQLCIRPNQFLYLGDGDQDWRTAINSAVFYLHAAWASPNNGRATAIEAGSPRDVLVFATHFLMLPPRWMFRLDGERGLHLRVLLSNNSKLQASRPRIEFQLIDILKYNTSYDIGSMSARDVLMLHTLSSLYLEGCIARQTLFVIYPSSTPGATNPVLQSFLKPASKFFHSFFLDDLIVRHAQAPDTSYLRWLGNREQVTFATQANTVCLNEKYVDRVQGSSVIVFDDFVTSGKSLDWARNLLQAAGASQITLVAIGKYSSSYEYYSTQKGADFSPFGPEGRRSVDFYRRFYQVDTDPIAEKLIQKSLKLLIADEPFPLSRDRGK